jgi:DNA-binding MarR family transcriptional regulator
LKGAFGMQLREWGGKNISPQYRKIVMSLIKIKRALRTTEVGAEFNVLGYIARHDYETPATPSQIAHHLYMTMPMVTKVIRTLSKKKYIIVATDVQDRRKVHLQLSEAGKRNFKHKITTIHK